MQKEHFQANVKVKLMIIEWNWINQNKQTRITEQPFESSTLLQRDAYNTYKTIIYLHLSLRKSSVQRVMHPLYRRLPFKVFLSRLNKHSADEKGAPDYTWESEEKKGH